MRAVFLRAPIALSFAAFVSGCGADGLSIGNIVANNGSLSLKIANDSARADDIVLWIEQNGLISCEHITSVEGRMTYDLRFTCQALSNGRFTVRVAWAKDSRARALVARRIN